MIEQRLFIMANDLFAIMKRESLVEEDSIVTEPHPMTGHPSIHLWKMGKDNSP